MTKTRTLFDVANTLTTTKSAFPALQTSWLQDRANHSDILREELRAHPELFTNLLLKEHEQEWMRFAHLILDWAHTIPEVKTQSQARG